ncbi:MAG: hypothetical protein CVU11_06185 [Bacteroidetes bacterium HGW-Bacteroidetes-6]|jgi:hypothetical protein|nr:MAG: hypothetical protein CVU11_06185 [Bacteroidetes bacterium HGW-Bacteroidetes-6]
MKIYSLLILFSLLVTSCKIDSSDEPSCFSDSFDNAQTINDLFPDNESQWSYKQITREANYLDVDTAFGHYASGSVHFVAAPSDAEGASKCSINKQFMAFREGHVFHMSAWYYISGTEKRDYLFIFDLEEKAVVGAGPGMRLALVGSSGWLEVEHKYNQPNIRQKEGSEISFPRNEWVHVEMETLLSKKDKGYVKVWQNGTLILEQYNWQTLPRDFLYFQQGTKGEYDSVEFGISANSHDGNTELWVDDIEVWTSSQ